MKMENIYDSWVRHVRLDLEAYINERLSPKTFKLELGERCVVSVFEFYLLLIPCEGPFYRRPLSRSPVRYYAQVIGVNKLNVIVKTFCEKAVFQGYFTNYLGGNLCH